MPNNDMDKRKIDEQKRIFDAVTKAWLDDKFATFGRWTASALMAVVFVLFLKFIFHLNANDLRDLLETTVRVQDVAR